MRENELKKLKRSELLEILLRQNEQIDALKADVERLNAKLNSREITLQQTGSIAEAALELNGVFSAAQAACEQYIENIQRRSEQQEQICSDMLHSTEEKCRKMVSDAQQEADDYWTKTQNQIQQILKETEGLRELLAH